MTNTSWPGTVLAWNRVYDDHLIFTVVSHWHITPLSQSYDIPPGHIILAKGRLVFALNYPLYEYLTRELKNYQFEIFGSTRPGIEPWTSQVQNECFTTRLANRGPQIGIVWLRVILSTKFPVFMIVKAEQGLSRDFRRAYFSNNTNNKENSERFYHPK